MCIISDIISDMISDMISNWFLVFDFKKAVILNLSSQKNVYMLLLMSIIRINIGLLGLLQTIRRNRTWIRNSIGIIDYGQTKESQVLLRDY